MKVGFIGLGIMGKPMAGHLLAGGHELYAYTRGAVSEELTSKGAKVCKSSQEVAQQADVIITMVPDTPDVEAVLFGANGIAAGISKGKTEGRHELDLSGMVQALEQLANHKIAE